MKFGLQLHADRGADAILVEARSADEQSFDSVWTGDHLLGIRGDPVADGPLETWTLMTAIGAVTERVRIGFAMLNPSFRNPALLAKMLATLDQITHGRVICSLGAGWFEDEYTQYGIPFIADHDARIAHEREVALLLKQLWTNPAPERTSFSGSYVQTKDLPFNPRPYQQPHPPIWIGGNSAATQALVREFADGWVLLSMGDVRSVLVEALAHPEWPERHLTIVGGVSLQADDSLGHAEERIGVLAEWGVNYVRMTFANAEQQAAFAREVLTREPAAPSP